MAACSHPSCGPARVDCRPTRDTRLRTGFFVFTKGPLGREVVFCGLAVPGASDVTANDDLVAVWRTTSNQRFQNYRSLFTLLDTGSVVTRGWLQQLVAGDADSPPAPPAWTKWRATGKYTALVAPATRTFRTKADQIPANADDAAMIDAIIDHFADPHDFKRCAAAIWEMVAPASDYTLTPPTRDGGRDAFGTYSIGNPTGDPINLKFSLEAKLYTRSNSVNVSDLARLISRLRHREFGVLVTTSFLAQQAYQELRADQHPVVVLAGGDIVVALKRHGIATAAATKAWLTKEFPVGDS